jgi:flagella basal body P-ring formation protein FlgA
MTRHRLSLPSPNPGRLGFGRPLDAGLGRRRRNAGRCALALGCFQILVWSTGGFAQPVVGSEPSIFAFQLQPAVQVDSEGVFLQQVLSGPVEPALPPLRLAPAPAFGRSGTLSRARIQEVLSNQAPQLASAIWTGPDQIQVTRRARPLAEPDLLELLTATLQREHVKDRGQLEIRLARPWTSVSVPDEPITLGVLDLPATGVTPSLLVRFELRTAREVVGTWQVSAQAKVWREVWVTTAATRRGAPLADAAPTRERRDVLTLRESLADPDRGDAAIELAEYVPAGAILYARALKLCSVVRRGQHAEASLQDGALAISMKVEVLEDGAPGQIVRVRNLQSRRELRGKVIDEHTISVTL